MASHTSLFDPHGGSTPGQITLAFLHTEIDYEERREKVHPHCVDKFDSDEVICEICHEPWNPIAFKAMLKEFEDSIYRPGEDISKLDNLTSAEMEERQAEIEAIFADPTGYRPTDREEEDDK
jgi:hypothetical protein